jgi:hypothetical protein
MGDGGGETGKLGDWEINKQLAIDRDRYCYALAKKTIAAEINYVKVLTKFIHV